MGRSMVLQIKKKVLVFDQPFLQPHPVYRVEFFKGLDRVHGFAFHLTHGASVSDARSVGPKIS
jgi:hypothetical protein